MSERIHAFGENGELSDGAELALEDFLITKVNPALSEVVAGDTGWRRIDTLTSVTGGTVVMRRVGELVHMMLADVTVAAAGHVNVAPTPPGFAPQSFTGANWRNGVVMDVAATSLRVASWLGNNMRILNAETGKAYGGCLSWITDDPWPTTLPGDPA